jgi:hypothetical protein
MRTDNWDRRNPDTGMKSTSGTDRLSVVGCQFSIGFSETTA